MCTPPMPKDSIPEALAVNLSKQTLVLNKGRDTIFRIEGSSLLSAQGGMIAWEAKAAEMKRRHRCGVNIVGFVEPSQREFWGC